MCSILFAYQQHPKYPLIVLANRDEFYKRPTLQADWWKEHSEMLAGKDAVGNGSWFGMSKLGRFSALTNYRDGFNIIKDAPTRGKLVTNYLINDIDTRTYLEGVAVDSHLYNGYNLLTFDGKELFHYSNISNEITPIKAGIHGVSNALLNTSWPKIDNGKASLAQLIDIEKDFSVEAGFELLLNEKRPADQDLPNTGVPIEWERKLSSLCIKTEGYGTRCSTVMLWGTDGKIYYEERSYVPDAGKKVFEVSIKDKV
ncbi:MAG: NRDE family protein [Saprospiraceae bacterium]